MCVADDGALLYRARKGDEAAFSELYARHRRAILRYAIHMAGHDIADDVVQETFLAVLKQTNHGQEPRVPVAYLIGIARHIILKRLRLPIEEAVDDETPFLASTDMSPLEELTRDERVHAVRTAIDTLPTQYREAIVLCELGEVDYATAATIMECPIGTVRSRLSRGRALLLRKLSELVR